MGICNGTTSGLGANSAGTVFRITASGDLTTLYSFCALANCADGASPRSALVAVDGVGFFGTTYEDGPDDGGTVFRISAGGRLTTLYAFCSSSGCADGSNPGGLVRGTDGSFYGTTQTGGAYGWSTVFKITTAGKLKTLYSFCASAGCPDGYYSEGGLVQGTDGTVYGTTAEG
jgi:uncharacterized repeat protein (TIGR03803 family)